jgi:soluble lytic murein transglycosylase-like protein
MPPSRPLHLVAALLSLSVPALCVAPAAAQTTTASTPEATLASVMRSFNPHLTLARARAYARSVMADAMRTHLDPRFIMSIVTVESGWHSNAVSRVGARGLGQLMPGTAANLGVNPRDAADNLRGTSRYLKSLVTRFAGKPNGLKLAIAGYNAGPKAVERYHGIPPYAETQRYVAKVLHVWNELNSRVGFAFTNTHWSPVRVATRIQPPDEQQWVNGSVTSALPQSLPEATPAAPITIGAPASAAAAPTL